MWFPSVGLVISIHDAILERGGGESGLLHRGSLEAAIGRARWGPFSEGDLAERAALILRGIARDHPFLDGNKRTAYEVVDVFLWLNGQELTADQDDVVETMVQVARGEIDLEGIAEWLQRSTEKR